MCRKETELTTKLSNKGMSWWGILGIALRLIDLDLRADEEGKLEMPTGADKNALKKSLLSSQRTQAKRAD